jgi:hypothetical protein
MMKPRAFIQFLVGAGAAKLAFLPTFYGYEASIASLILIVCILPDTL